MNNHFGENTSPLMDFIKSNIDKVNEELLISGIEYELDLD